MTPSDLIVALRASGEAIVRFYDGVAVDQARWKPDPNTWSLLEILCHLVDEERDDFRTRLRLTLEDPTADWPPIDPEGWARDRDYNSRELVEMVSVFDSERSTSLKWLTGLDDPDWHCEHRHPKFGSMEAGTLLASWAAHDVLHVGQIARTRFAHIRETVTPFSTRYAKP